MNENTAHSQKDDSVLARLPKGTIVRLVTGIDRRRPVHEIFTDTKNRKIKIHAGWIIVDAPRFYEMEKRIYYIPPSQSMTLQEHHTYVASFGMRVDLALQYRDNELDPAFADNYPNIAVVLGDCRRLGFAAWRMGSERDLHVVGESGGRLGDFWWSGCCE